MENHPSAEKHNNKSFKRGESLSFLNQKVVPSLSPHLMQEEQTKTENLQLPHGDGLEKEIAAVTRHLGKYPLFLRNVLKKRQGSGEETAPFISLQAHPFGLELMENIFLCPERCKRHLWMRESEKKPCLAGRRRSWCKPGP